MHLKSDNIEFTLKSMLYLWKKLLKKLANDKIDWKVRDHCHYIAKYRGAGHSICNLNYSILNEIPVVVHSIIITYGYHFIIKELANKFKGEFQCLGENTEKCKSIFCSNRKRSGKN